MKLFAKIPTSVLRTPAPIDGLVIASDAATVAHRYGPHGYDEGAPDPRLSLVQVVTAIARPCGPAAVVAALRETGRDASGTVSCVQCLRDPEVRIHLEALGFDGYAGRTADGRHAVEVAWKKGTYGIVREDRSKAGTVEVDDDAFGIELTTMGRQLALDLLREGHDVARTARSHGSTEDVGERATRHALAWLLDACARPDGTSIGFDRGAVVTRTPSGRFVHVLADLDLEAAVDAGAVALRPLAPRVSMGMG